MLAWDGLRNYVEEETPHIRFCKNEDTAEAANSANPQMAGLPASTTVCFLLLLSHFHHIMTAFSIKSLLEASLVNTASPEMMPSSSPYPWLAPARNQISLLGYSQRPALPVPKTHCLLFHTTLLPVWRKSAPDVVPSPRCLRNQAQLEHELRPQAHKGSLSTTALCLATVPVLA